MFSQSLETKKEGNNDGKKFEKGYIGKVNANHMAFLFALPNYGNDISVVGVGRTPPFQFIWNKFFTITCFPLFLFPGFG